MEPDALRLFLEVGTVAATALAALIGVKIGLNGMKKDTHNIATDVQELKVSLREAAAQRADLDRRLAFVEGEVGQIGHTLARMEGI
jgi:hypothetical protein